MSVPTVGPPTWSAENRNVLIFDGTIIKSEGCFRRHPDMSVSRYPDDACAILVDPIQGEIEDMLHGLDMFVLGLLLIEDIREVVVKGNIIILEYDDSVESKLGEIHYGVDEIIDDTWNIVDVDRDTYDELEDVSSGGEEWPDIIGD